MEDFSVITGTDPSVNFRVSDIMAVIMADPTVATTPVSRPDIQLKCLLDIIMADLWVPLYPIPSHKRWRPQCAPGP